MRDVRRGRRVAGQRPARPRRGDRRAAADGHLRRDRLRLRARAARQGPRLPRHDRRPAARVPGVAALLRRTRETDRRPGRTRRWTAMTLGPRDAVLVFTHDPKLDVPAVAGRARDRTPATSARSAAAARPTTATSACASAGVSDAELARVLRAVRSGHRRLDGRGDRGRDPRRDHRRPRRTRRTGAAGDVGADPARARRGGRGDVAVGSRSMAAMKWWGWGDEGVAFTHDGQARARARSSSENIGARRRRADARARSPFDDARRARAGAARPRCAPRSRRRSAPDHVSADAAGPRRPRLRQEPARPRAPSARGDLGRLPDVVVLPGDRGRGRGGPRARRSTPTPS